MKTFFICVSLSPFSLLVAAATKTKEGAAKGATKTGASKTTTTKTPEETTKTQ